MTTQPTPTGAESQQDAYYRELRRDRLINMYLDGMHRIKHFEHSSVGIALADKIYKLSDPLPK